MNKLKEKIFLSLLLLTSSLFFSCSKKADLVSVENTLLEAKENKGELLKTLAHYRDKDSLKYLAAKFLIENMPIHQTYCGQIKTDFDKALYERLENIDDSIRVNIGFNDPSIKAIFDSISKVHGRPYFQVCPDVENISSDFLIKNIDLAFRCWKHNSFSKHYSFEQFCEYILPYRSTTEVLEDWRPDFETEFKHQIDSFYGYSDIVEVTNFINEKIEIGANKAFTFYPMAQSISKMRKGKIGKCEDQVNMAIFALRANGIAAAYDFTPMWANFYAGHSWNSMILPDGSSHDFLGTRRNTEEHYFWYKVPKVYRKTYSVQKDRLNIIQDVNGNVPPALKKINMIDVTSSYFETKDLEFELDAPFRSEKLGYLCVFGDRKWTPVDWGKVDNGVLSFTAVSAGGRDKKPTFKAAIDDIEYFSRFNEGEGIVYLPSIYQNSDILPVDNAFILKENGKVISLKPDRNNTQEVILFRKYPMTLRKLKWREQLVGVKFEISNTKNFKFSHLVHVIDSLPNECYNSVFFEKPVKCSFFRILKNDTLPLHLAEIKFYDSNEKLIQAKELSNSFGDTKKGSRVLDNKSLTYFSDNTNKNVKHIIFGFGLKTEIAKIVFEPRNDGNSVIPGNQYELLFWNGTWVSLGEKNPSDYYLSFSEAPSNALFWLRNLTSGKEERIFTYENNTQIWW